jgi:hypothetical protein
VRTVRGVAYVPHLTIRMDAVLPWDRNFAMLSYVLNCLWHCILLAPITMLFGVNLNYQASPPRSRILRPFGTWYRPVLFFSSIFVTLGLRYFYILPVGQVLQELRA